MIKQPFLLLCGGFPNFGGRWRSNPCSPPRRSNRNVWFKVRPTCFFSIISRYTGLLTKHENVLLGALSVRSPVTHRPPKWTATTRNCWAVWPLAFLADVQVPYSHQLISFFEKFEKKNKTKRRAVSTCDWSAPPPPPPPPFISSDAAGPDDRDRPDKPRTSRHRKREKRKRQRNKRPKWATSLSLSFFSFYFGLSSIGGFRVPTSQSVAFRSDNTNISSIVVRPKNSIGSERKLEKKIIWIYIYFKICYSKLYLFYLAFYFFKNIFFNTFY